MSKQQSLWLGGVICFFATLFYVYDYFVQVAPSVMVSDLMRDFQIDAQSLGILSACFFYSYAIMQIPAGWMLDHFGARKILSLAVLVSAIGVIVFSQAKGLWVAGLGRFLVGIGSAFSFISTLYLISRWFSHKYFATLAGFVQLGGCVGSMIGLAPIAVVVNNYGWRFSMLVTGEVTLILAVLFFWLIQNGPQKRATETHKTSFSEVKNILVNKQVLMVCVCGLLCWVPVGGVGALWGVPYMMKAYHIDNTTAGEYIAWFWLGVGLGSPLVGWLSHYLSRRRIPMLLCFCAALVASLLLIEAAYLPLIVCIFALFLLGFSASIQSLTFGIMKDLVPEKQFGFMSGVLNMAAIIGGGIAQPLIGFILNFSWQGHYANGIPLYTLKNYQYSLYLLPAIALIGVWLTTFLLKETYCAKHLHTKAVCKV